MHPRRNWFLISGITVAVAFMFYMAAVVVPHNLRTYWHYGEAESFVERVKVFHNQLTDSETTPSQLLRDREFADLKQRRIPSDLNGNEMLRFRVNCVFDIGLKKDGGIIWHLNDD